MYYNYIPLESEKAILDFWKFERIYEKAKARNKGKEKFYFLDGPPYTSGRIHIGQAWNKSLKDAVLRYKRMKGFDVFDRAGYDMHGLPTEHKAEEELKLKNKDDIPAFGVEKFIEKCREICTRNMQFMNTDFQRLGIWMDFENAYQSITPEFIDAEWWLIKKAHENNRLYLGKKTMHWCAHCGTSLAKHELDYETRKDDSVYIKFPVEGKEKEFLIVWTTTPWTLAFNLGVMVNPELEYVRAEVDDETWIIAKLLANVFISAVAEKKFKIIEELSGEKLKGLKYVHPWRDEIKSFSEIDSPKVHTVVMSAEYVTTDAGSGLVHLAPGCGPEDYEVGHREGLPPFNNLDELGRFPESMGKFSGFIAKRDDGKFIEALGEHLIAKVPVEHEYPNCWRCHKPVIFRTTEQWFFRVEDLKEEMRALNKEVFWQPNWAGSNWFDSWIDNLRDNGITRQRYWGVPLPVWICKKCDNYVVIGSQHELKQLSGQQPKELHKPWIDEITLPCVCGEKMNRVPDVLDVWIDSGVASWAALNYPQKTDSFEKLFPADFILEGKDQIRGWFNMLLIAAMVSMKKHPYKAVYMHGFVQDSQGRKMSKSLGNVISPYEIIDVYGSDTLRYYMISGANPGIDINYNLEDMKVKNRNLVVLWNLHNYLLDLIVNHKIDVETLFKEKIMPDVEEQYILSKLNSTVKKATELMDSYRINEVPVIIEELFLELSRTYIQFVRDKIDDGEARVVVYALYKVLFETLKIFSIIAPFITEGIYQNLRSKLKLKEESVHLLDWPSFDEGLINKKLEAQFAVVKGVIQAILFARDKAALGVRWPLKEVIITTHDSAIEEAVSELQEIIRTYTNVKEVRVMSSLPGIKLNIRGDFNQIGPDFKEFAPKVIARLSIDSPQSILAHLEKEQKFPMNIDGVIVNVVKEHLIITKEIPEQFVESEFRNGHVYINKILTEELEAEGYTREIIRRIQSLRKRAGLDKRDKIALAIQLDNRLREMISRHIAQIKAKVNAVEFMLTEVEKIERFKHSSKEKIKGKEIVIYLEKKEE